ncbi:MAG TPA: MupA/Atu3671 family FMN-dependent luciferase-like monooxygenase [Lacunisphaera sp.]|nr:MupA/Atu3671 family FMN-dependent luciferase-like monooxygenase [Lacunisphaera sp.]
METDATVLPAPEQPAPAAVIPASSGQRRLWFLEQMEPGSPLYNIPYLIRLSGPLDEPSLRRALNAVVARHESLRTNFAAVGSEPVQVVRPVAELTLPVTDLASLPEADRPAELLRLAATEARAPFDLARDLPVRVRLYRLSATEHALMLVMHHIASDGWSMGIVYRELGQCYDAFLQGRAPQLPELDIQYADFALWQHDHLQGATLDRLTGYWKKQMAGAPALLELPTDHARPPLQSHRGETVSLRLPPTLVTRLKQLGASHRVTFFMTLLAGFKAVLHRYTGQTDLVVGSPLAGRDSAETEAVVGFFINTVLLRTDLSGDPTVAELLARVREVSLGAFEHREMPYEKLVEELQPQRNLSFDPICQVFFALQNMPTTALRLGNLKLGIEPVYTGTAKSDLTVWAAESDCGSLDVTAEYALDLFTATTIRRFLGHFASLLGGMADNPRERLSALPLLTAAERTLMLKGWNATAADYPREATLPALFEQQAARTPQATALVFNDDELTYAELDARAESLAAQLRKHGIGPDALVGICMERSLDMMVGLLAIHKAGGAYVPLDPVYPKERLAFMLQDSGATVLLTQLSLLPKLPPHQAAVICVDAPAPVNGVHPESTPPFSVVGPEHLAYVLYTSGSTGNPKGVMVTHRNAVNFFAGMDRALDHSAADTPGVWLAVTSISFDISVLELFWTLCRGFKVVLLADEAKRPGVAVAREAARPKRVLDFSLFYFASEAGGSGDDAYRLLLEGAKFADRHGFKAVWTPERHFHSFGGLYPNPSVVSAAIAAVTERVQIRAGSVVSPLHHPARIAEEWSVVDNLSRGRVGISFANGWHDRDFTLSPANFADRREIMRRNIATVRSLWRGETVEFPGGRGNAVPVKIFPRPVQAELPVWITAAGNPETFRLAGEMGAGILTHLLGQELNDLAKKIQIYREARKAHGHDEGCVTIALHTFVGEDLAAVKEKVRAPLCRYLADSADLLKGLSQALYPGAEMKNLAAEEMNALVEYSFNRYFDLCGLLGTPATCQAVLQKLAALGVDEVACLIDFGVETEAALKSLELLARVRTEFQAAATAGTEATRPAPARAPRSVVEQIQRHGVTHLQCTPSYARLLAGSPETLGALKALRKLMVGGEALPVGLAAQLTAELPATVLNMYGPTETTIWSTTSRVTGEPNPSGAVDIGHPIANTQVYVLDAHRQPVPIGVPGELWISGDGVARGYWHRPELTAEKFTADPFLPGNRMYRTGDLVRYRADGVIDFLGRIDHQVKLRGHRVELGEIECALMQHSGVRQAVVVLRSDDPADPRLVAYLVAAETEPTVEALREFLRQKLPEHMVPSVFVTLPQLPLTPNGKVDRKQLPAPAASRATPGAGFVAPGAGMEQAIAAIWKDILNTETIGVDDNFFDFGGHSLQVVQVQNRLREALQIDVPVLKLFQFPTIRMLAGYLAEQSPGRTDSFRSRIEDRNRVRQAAAIRRRPPVVTARP